MQIISKYLKTCCFIGSVLTIGLFSSLVIAASPPAPANRRVPADSLADSAGEAEFHQEIQPLLKKYCYACHSGSVKSGGVAFDGFKSYAALEQDHKLFQKVLKNLRGGLMPPAGMSQPAGVDKQRIAQWIKTHIYRIDPANPDPGRVTARRLNRVEYRNTIRDLVGVDYDTQTEFPPDDAGHGFDNISDALTLSPMLMEKYLDAAQTIISQAVPTAAKVTAETEIPGADFAPEVAAVSAVSSEKSAEKAAAEKAPAFRALSYYEAATVSHALQIEHSGAYQFVLDLSANEKYVDNQFDYNRCRLIVRADGQELLRQEFNREGGKLLHYVFDQKWQAGRHHLSFEIQPLTPRSEQIRALTLRINKVTLRGPFDPKYEVEPRNYQTFFPRPVPTGAMERRAYARERLGVFARKAFRRPVDERTLDRLAALAESVYTQPGQTFEAGVAQAMTAVLASPRFLFREEGIAPAQVNRLYAQVDEYSLASRLSYFLWSSMPDDELFRLAAQGTLRKSLPAQMQRMLRDPRSEALIQNFSGQWLQTRDVAKVAIDARAVLRREIDPAAPVSASGANRRPRIFFDEALRRDLGRETECYFDHIVRDDCSVLELLDSNYTFLNARLAQYYGLTNANISGEEFRKVILPEGSPRGGILTMGSVLAVTSNPTRTSPVKRGLFILDNILGSPPPPPPPNIPPLEAAAAGLKNNRPILREVLAAHRSRAECFSCHQRLDPPGLALENFNAMGLWRDREFGQAIEPGGTLVTGESFKDIRELKHILVRRHSADFYHCLTEKLLTYALGRGLEEYDAEAVDRIAQRLEQDKGRFSSLLTGIIESAPFQKCRNPSAITTAAKESGRQ